MDADARAATVAYAQGGEISRRQALDLGFTPKMIEHRLARGRWRLVRRGQYRLFEVDGVRGLLEAAVGKLPNAVVSHESAAEIHRFPLVRRGLAVVTVHSRTTHSFPGVRVRRSLDLAIHHRVEADGLPVTTPERTIVDLAGIMREGHLSRVVDETLAAGTVQIDPIIAVLEEVARKGRRGCAVLRRMLVERIGSPTLSATTLERSGHRLLSDSGLTDIQVEYPIPWAPGRRWDVAFPGSKVAIEWDSRRWHTRVADFENDRRRDREAVTHGWVLLRFTWEDVTRRPEELIDQVTVAVRARRP